MDDLLPIDQFRRPSADSPRGAYPCFLCGRATDNSRHVHLATGGSLVPRDEILAPRFDQGWFPIGPECARRLPARFVARSSS